MHKKLDELTVYKLRTAAAECVAIEMSAQKSVDEARSRRAAVWAKAGLLPDQGVYAQEGPSFGTILHSTGLPVDFPDSETMDLPK